MACAVALMISCASGKRVVSDVAPVQPGTAPAEYIAQELKHDAAAFNHDAA